MDNLIRSLAEIAATIMWSPHTEREFVRHYNRMDDDEIGVQGVYAYMLTGAAEFTLDLDDFERSWESWA